MTDTMTQLSFTADEVRAIVEDNRYRDWANADANTWDHSEKSLCCGTTDSIQPAILAYIGEDWDAAIAENAIRAEYPVAPVETAADRDARAAEAQAEILGANAEQRAKLRVIVSERRDALAEVERLRTEVEYLRRPITDAEDERVIGFFVAAAQEANAQGYCSTYDQIANAVNLPTRDRLIEMGAIETPIWDLQVYVNLRIPVTVTMSGRNADEALSDLSRSEIVEAVNEVSDLEDYVEDWRVSSVDRVED